MTYRVDLAVRALTELQALYEEKQVERTEAAAQWFNGLAVALFTLKQLPQRCPRIPEQDATSREIRHLLYGKKPHVYRIVFEISEQRAMVRILTICHGARKLPRSSLLN